MISHRFSSGRSGIPWLCLMVLTFAATMPQANAADFDSLKVGFKGIGKVGTWLPIEALVSELPQGADVQLRAVFSDPRGDSCIQIVDHRTSVESSGRILFSGLFRVGRMEGTGQIQIVAADSNRVLCRHSITHGGEVALADEESRVHSTLKMHRLGVPFLVTFGEIAGIEELLRNAENFRAETSLLEGLRFESLAELPSSANGLQAIDMILLTDEFETSEQQANAVREWVLQGGSLFVSSGKTVSAFVESEIGKWLSQIFEIQSEAINVKDLSAMQSFVSGSTILQTNRETLSMAVLNSDQNVKDVASLDGAIVARQSVGAGIVQFVAVDVNKKPVAGWPSLPAFYEVLFLGGKLTRQTTQESRSTRISQSGISDLSTQMMATVDAVPEGGRWSTWAVMALVVVYLLLIGPVDYLLVTHVLKRPHFTWITFPLLIAAGAWGLYSAAGSGASTRLNQLHIMDVVPVEDASYVHTQSWMSVSSAETMRSDLTAKAEGPGASKTSQGLNLELTWSGRPEDIYGGMYRVGGIGLGRQSYTHDASAAEKLQGVPMLTKGSRELKADWSVTSDSTLVSSDLSVSGYGLLNGSFSHSLPFGISDWVIMHGNRVYRHSEEVVLESGIALDCQADEMYASDIKAYLNASHLIKKAGKDAGNRGVTQVVTPYDSKSTDTNYIVTMSTFYKAGGASKYVGLSNALLGQVELSETIRMNHAVLIGVADEPGTSLMVGEESLPPSRSKTIVRMLLPIDRRPSERLAPKQEDAK